MRAERITDSLCYHGEGPVRWPTGDLRWVDMLAGDVLTMDARGEVTRTHVGSVVACLRPRQGGGAVLALEHAVALADHDDLSDVAERAEIITDPGIRFNEGGCDPDGLFWVGSMAYDKGEGRARLWRLGSDLSPVVELPAVTISNGIDWSPDGAVGYYNDTATGTVSLFGLDDQGRMTDRRTFVDCGELHPDGLTVDADGGVWVAMNGAGAVHRYAPDGTLDEVVEVGARQATACTFGGEDLRTLYVTTSREGLGDDDDPAAGSVFAAEPGVAGRPARTFRG